jgi:hypothetical protein
MWLGDATLGLRITRCVLWVAEKPEFPKKINVAHCRFDTLLGAGTYLFVGLAPAEPHPHKELGSHSWS